MPRPNKDALAPPIPPQGETVMCDQCFASIPADFRPHHQRWHDDGEGITLRVGRGRVGRKNREETPDSP